MGMGLGPGNYLQILMDMGAGKGTILPSPATRIYVFFIIPAYTYLYSIINTLFIFCVQLFSLFSYLSLNLNLI